MSGSNNGTEIFNLGDFINLDLSEDLVRLLGPDLSEPLHLTPFQDSVAAPPSKHPAPAAVVVDAAVWTQNEAVSVGGEQGCNNSNNCGTGLDLGVVADVTPVVTDVTIGGTDEDLAAVVAGATQPKRAAAVPCWVPFNGESQCGGGCLVLREVLYCSEHFGTMTIEVHGLPGFFHHATLVAVSTISSGSVHQYFADLRGFSAAVVKEFLRAQGYARQDEGMSLMGDSAHDFYDALGVDMSGGTLVTKSISTSVTGSISTATDSSDNSSVGAGGPLVGVDSPNVICPAVPAAQCKVAGKVTGRRKAKQQRTSGSGKKNSRMADGGNLGIHVAKTGLSLQRERTGNLQLEDINMYFNITISAAAIELRVCPTVLKKVCRREGIGRWPYRKVKSTTGMIAKLQRNLRKQTGDAAAKTWREIQRLTDERERACEGFAGRLRRLDKAIISLQEKYMMMNPADHEATKYMEKMERLRVERNRVIKARVKANSKDN